MPQQDYEFLYEADFREIFGPDAPINDAAFERTQIVLENHKRTNNYRSPILFDIT